jgi:hypothetical protein
LILGVYAKRDEKLANVIFAPIHDRRDRSIFDLLSPDQEALGKLIRKER